jgi:hypothetical protein
VWWPGYRQENHQGIVVQFSGLKDVFTPHDQGKDQEIETELAKPVHSTASLPAITFQKLQQEIVKLKTRKAPGMDITS